MKRYTIQCPVERAGGNQWWTVIADSKEEAIDKFKKVGGEFEGEEVEVTDLGEPEIIHEEDVEVRL